MQMTRVNNITRSLLHIPRIDKIVQGKRNETKIKNYRNDRN